MEPSETGLVVPGIDKVKAAANQVQNALTALTTARQKQVASEERMNELQNKAEEISFQLVTAEVAEREAVSGLHSVIGSEVAAKSALDEALKVLEEAKLLVAEEQRNLEVATTRRIEHEQSIAPACIKVRSLQSEMERYRLLAKAEAARVASEVAKGEERLINSQLAGINARLEILSSPAALESWPQLREVIEI